MAIAAWNNWKRRARHLTARLVRRIARWPGFQRVPPWRTAALLRTINLFDLKRKRREAANAANGEFLALMIHEMRTPLHAILGWAQLLERSELDALQRHQVARILEAGETLRAFFNDTLDFCKIESGTLVIEARPFALESLLARLDSMLGRAARAKGLSFGIVCPPLPPGALLGDARRLEEILINLIGNAIKFTEHGEIRVTVELLDAAPDRARLRFAVTDTGIGIPPDTLDRLFAPFAQGDAGIARRFGGTGLGLTICKRLAERMGGAIGVTSQPGAGSTFWCALPFARAAADAAAPPPVPADLPAAGPRLAGARLLVVDDSALGREVVEQMLMREGARVTPAADGAAALALLRARPRDFDAVLMDVQMPVLDGLSATRGIRTELGLTALPIVALTAGPCPADAPADACDALLAVGMNAVLLKPVRQDRMVAAIGPLLRLGTRGPAPDPAADRRDDPATDFPAIPGLDRERALEILNGDRTMFLRLLDRFLTDSDVLVKRVRRDLARGRRQAAARRLHNLRGHAGTLGSVDIMDLARRLETAIDRGEADVDDDLSDLEHRLAHLNVASAAWRGAADCLAKRTRAGG